MQPWYKSKFLCKFFDMKLLHNVDVLNIHDMVVMSLNIIAIQKPVNQEAPSSFKHASIQR